MFRIRPLIVAATCAFILPWFGILACNGVPPQPSDDGSGSLAGTVIDLTQAERDGALAGLHAASALTRATSTSQSGTRLEPEQNAQTIPQDEFFGTCPVVGLALTEGLTDFSVTVDFGDGCELPAEAGTCSGSAFGDLDRLNNTLTLALNELSCNGVSLNGSVSATYSVDGGRRTMTGTWSLRRAALDKEDGTTDEVSTFGDGVTVYDGDAQAVEVTDFTGSVTTEDGTWNASAEGLVVSLVQNESLIPTGGIVTILNDDTRTIIVRFNENSPTTGEVEISINGSDFFAVNLEEL